MHGLIPAHAGKTAPSPCTQGATWAHPHSRGENAYQSRARDIFKGSSPLTQGKLADQRRTHFRVGLIPAHAGKTWGRFSYSAIWWAHPHSRGENANRAPRYCTVTGSSPLTRGKHAVLVRHVEARGLIPAHAGKTYSSQPTPCISRAHPRSRGENATDETTGGNQNGLIPAHAGKTRARTLRSEPYRAHPRSRGENTVSTRTSALSPGSSPLTRGKLSWHFRRRHRVRLIPAHAGKTPYRPAPRLNPRAHPRSRGENHCRQRVRGCRRGSSPLTRGKRSVGIRPPELDGLIPAHAGKTGRRARG